MSTLQAILVGLCCIGVGMMIFNYGYKAGWRDAKRPHYPGFVAPPPSPPPPPRAEKAPLIPGLKEALPFMDQALIHMAAFRDCTSSYEALDRIYHAMVQLKLAGTSLEVEAPRPAVKIPSEWKLPDIKEVVWPAMTLEDVVRRTLQENPRVRNFVRVEHAEWSSVTVSLKREVDVPVSYARKILKALEGEQNG